MTLLLLHYSRYATGAEKSILNKEDRRCNNQITGNKGLVCKQQSTAGTFKPNRTCEYREVPHEIRQRIKLVAAGLAALAVLGVALAVGLWPQPDTALAQIPPGSSMDQRLQQIINVLQNDPGPEAAEAAINDSLEILYGGLRALPTHGELADQPKKLMKL